MKLKHWGGSTVKVPFFSFRFVIFHLCPSSLHHTAVNKTKMGEGHDNLQILAILEFWFCACPMKLKGIA